MAQQNQREEGGQDQERNAQTGQRPGEDRQQRDGQPPNREEEE